jgi:hypothetical protein
VSDPGPPHQEGREPTPRPASGTPALGRDGDVGAISGAFDAASLAEGVEQARADIEALSGSCAGTLGS